MHIIIEGKHIDLGDALRQHVRDRITDAVGKYFGDAIDASATFARDAGTIKVDCSVHVGHDIHLKSQGGGHEVYAAFEDAAGRIEKQLRRYKRRLKDHHSHQRQLGIAPVMAQDYTIARDDREEDDDDVPHGDNPTIIAEGRTGVPACTVSDAVMRLDLAGQPVLLFRNLGNDRLNIVYRRPDGHIGWIDPAEG